MWCIFSYFKHPKFIAMVTKPSNLKEAFYRLYSQCSESIEPEDAYITCSLSSLNTLEKEINKAESDKECLLYYINEHKERIRVLENALRENISLAQAQNLLRSL